MSSLVLLNNEGVVARKLQLVSLPDDYIVPEGMLVSWRMEVESWSRDSLASLLKPGPEPVEAYFYLGNARAQVNRTSIEPFVGGDFGRMRYGLRILTITVQGTSAKDVMALRDRIMHLVTTGAHWAVSNDLNPKRGFLHRLMGK